VTTVAIFPDTNGAVPRVYRASAGDREATGPTPGEAFKNLADQMGDPEETTLVIVQPMRPDRFFTADQIQRLGDLMAKWRTARDSGSTLPAEEQAELDALIQAELAGMIERTKALFGRTPL
jgi:hypothetical protein